MSARNRVVFSPEARKNLRDVLLFTRDRWGDDQRNRYRQILKEGFAQIGQFPLLGRSRPEYGENVRSQLIGMHIIFYVPTKTGIRITRIRHQHHDATVNDD